MAKKTAVSVEQMNEEARKRLVAGIGGEGAHLSFEDAVRDFPERLMNVKPPNVPYTFWHQLEHIRRSLADMLSYIQDPSYVAQEWPKDYWPAQDATTDRAGWDNTIKGYYDVRKRFLRVLNDSDTNLLALEKRGDGEEGSIFESTLLMIDHTAYHLGEFVMGRQILGEWKSELA